MQYRCKSLEFLRWRRGKLAYIMSKVNGNLVKELKKKRALITNHITRSERWLSTNIPDQYETQIEMFEHHWSNFVSIQEEIELNCEKPKMRLISDVRLKINTLKYDHFTESNQESKLEKCKYR